MSNDTARHDTERYRSTCECGWEFTHKWYGTVEERALEHMDSAGLGHTTKQPFKVEQ